MLALVTGASSGIGMATVKLFKEKGFTTIAVSRRVPEVGDHRFSLDVSNLEAVRDFARRVRHEIGVVDFLVNNAGFGVYGDFLETPLEEEDYMVRTNLLGTIYMTKQFLPPMVERRSGHVVNVVSEAAYVNSPKLLVYSATKAAVASFTNGLWSSVRGKGVRICGVYPGPVRTGFTSHPSFKGREGGFSKYAVEPDRVAKAIYRGGIKGKREIFVPSKLILDPPFLKLANLFQGLTYRVVSKMGI